MPRYARNRSCPLRTVPCSVAVPRVSVRNRSHSVAYPCLNRTRDEAYAMNTVRQRPCYDSITHVPVRYDRQVEIFTVICSGSPITNDGYSRVSLRRRGDDLGIVDPHRLEQVRVPVQRVEFISTLQNTDFARIFPCSSFLRGDSPCSPRPLFSSHRPPLRT